MAAGRVSVLVASLGGPAKFKSARGMRAVLDPASVEHILGMLQDAHYAVGRVGVLFALANPAPRFSPHAVRGRGGDPSGVQMLFWLYAGRAFGARLPRYGGRAQRR